jgi:hypothetical protein
MQVTCEGNKHPKKHVWLSIEIHFGIFCIFGIKQKYSYIIIYDCEKSPLTHELSYIGLFNFSRLNLFHVNVICKK